MGEARTGKGCQSKYPATRRGWADYQQKNRSAQIVELAFLDAIDKPIPLGLTEHEERTIRVLRITDQEQPPGVHLIIDDRSFDAVGTVTAVTALTPGDTRQVHGRPPGLCDRADYCFYWDCSASRAMSRLDS